MGEPVARWRIVQLHRIRDATGQPRGGEVPIVAEHSDADSRTEGTWLGVDFGLTAALFATSQGELAGHRMVTRRHRQLDAILTPCATDIDHARDTHAWAGC